MDKFAAQQALRLPLVSGQDVSPSAPSIGDIEEGRAANTHMSMAKVVVMGETGAGKSQLSAALIGNVPGGAAEHTCPVFHVSSEMSSCTFETRAHNAKWMGREAEEIFTMIDTPGLGDPTPGADQKHIAEMVRELKRQAHVNAFLLVFNSENVRLPAPTRQMMELFRDIFGEDFWRNTLMVFTRWYGDRASIRRRGQRDEDCVTKQFKAELMKPRSEGGLDVNPEIMERIPCYFLDSRAEPSEVEEFAKSIDCLERVSVYARSLKAFSCEAAQEKNTALGATQEKLKDAQDQLKEGQDKLKESERLAAQKLKEEQRKREESERQAEAAERRREESERRARDVACAQGQVGLRQAPPAQAPAPRRKPKALSSWVTLVIVTYLIQKFTATDNEYVCETIDYDWVLGACVPLWMEVVWLVYGSLALMVDCCYMCS